MEGGMSGITSIAELRRKYGPGNIPNETVSRETVSLHRHRGMGLDWLPAEIEVLKRTDLSVLEMVRLLPGRTYTSVRVKRHRIKVARPNLKHAIGSAA
jgi:hypothetical protein